MSDAELLQSYVREHSQTAFAELVQRHLDLVYSAALRQLRSPALAEEVAQTVFIELSRHAARLKPEQPLAAWLYLVTRHKAINVIRREVRRQERETTAAEIAAMKTPSPSWAQVAGLVDEAMATLSEGERAAVVLRFFQNQPLREVGAALGISDDAAQKRVARALDQLRKFFVRRGLAMTAAGLATDLSAHGLQTAPAGLGLVISKGAVAAGGMATTVGGALMTTTQKYTLAAALALALGTGAYEATAFARQRTELDALQRQTSELTARLAQGRQTRAMATTRLATIEREIDTRLARARLANDPALEAELQTWLERLTEVKRVATENPQLCVPEMALLSESDWLDLSVSMAPQFKEAPTKTLAFLRVLAETRMGNRIKAALIAFEASHAHGVPQQMADLTPFLPAPIEPNWLDRYELLQGEPLKPGGERTVFVRTKAPSIDIEADQIWTIRAKGEPSPQSAIEVNLSMAREGFAAAHPGAAFATSAELMPYLKWPMTEDQVKKQVPKEGKFPLRDTNTP